MYIFLVRVIFSHFAVHIGTIFLIFILASETCRITIAVPSQLILILAEGSQETITWRRASRTNLSRSGKFLRLFKNRFSVLAIAGSCLYADLACVRVRATKLSRQDELSRLRDVTRAAVTTMRGERVEKSNVSRRVLHSGISALRHSKSGRRPLHGIVISVTTARVT